MCSSQVRHMQILATLGQFNRRRGWLSWRFCQGADGSFFALRQDGRKFAYASKEEMREGYRKLRTEFRYAPVCQIA